MKACGFTKSTLYAIHPLMSQTVRKGATRDKKKYLNVVEYRDKSTGNVDKIVGIASAGGICEKPVFESFEDVNAPGLLRAHQEDCLAVSL